MGFEEAWQLVRKRVSMYDSTLAFDYNENIKRYQKVVGSMKKTTTTRDAGVAFLPIEHYRFMYMKTRDVAYMKRFIILAFIYQYSTDTLITDLFDIESESDLQVSHFETADDLDKFIDGNLFDDDQDSMDAFTTEYINEARRTFNRYLQSSY